MNTSYYIAFAFVSKETFEIYKWLYEYIKDLYEYLEIPDPNFILTDTQNSFIKASLSIGITSSISLTH